MVLASHARPELPAALRKPAPPLFLKFPHLAYRLNYLISLIRKQCPRLTRRDYFPVVMIRPCTASSVQLSISVCPVPSAPTVFLAMQAVEMLTRGRRAAELLRTATCKRHKTRRLSAKFRNFVPGVSPPVLAKHWSRSRSSTPSRILNGRIARDPGLDLTFGLCAIDLFDHHMVIYHGRGAATEIDRNAWWWR